MAPNSCAHTLSATFAIADRQISGPFRAASALRRALGAIVFHGSGESERMRTAEPLLTATAADAVLNALPHPVIVVSADGKVVDANVAAEAFFEVSVPLLRRHLLRDFVPFGSPLLDPGRTGAGDAARRSTSTKSISARRAIPATGLWICTWRRCPSGRITWW